MKKQIKLFFDMELSSLSSDAQIISLGIVSEGQLPEFVPLKTIPIEKLPKTTQDELKERKITTLNVLGYDKVRGEEVVVLSSCNIPLLFCPESWIIKNSKSFYAEFSDFDINRCDDWVKENVIKNLSLNDHERFLHHHNNLKRVKDDTRVIKKSLSNWLELFKDYEITFVADCGCFDWYHLLQLIAEWETLPNKNDNYAKWCVATNHYKTGLPKLPENISPVPLDLNDLIAHEKGISVREAFDMDRKWLVNDCTLKSEISTVWAMDMVNYDKHNHNSLFDSKIIKAIYEKLIR